MTNASPFLLFAIAAGFLQAGPSFAEAPRTPQNIVHAYVITSPQTGAATIRTKSMGQIDGVEHDPKDPRIVLIKSGKMVRGIFFVHLKEAQVFKRALQTEKTSFNIRGDWSENDASTRFKLGGRSGEGYSQVGKTTFFFDDFAIQDAKTLRHFTMEEFLRMEGKKQIREDELTQGDYRGVIGKAHKAIDYLRGVGTFSRKDDRKEFNHLKRSDTDAVVVIISGVKPAQDMKSLLAD